GGGQAASEPARPRPCIAFAGGPDPRRDDRARDGVAPPALRRTLLRRRRGAHRAPGLSRTGARRPRPLLGLPPGRRARPPAALALARALPPLRGGPPSRAARRRGLRRVPRDHRRRARRRTAWSPRRGEPRCPAERVDPRRRLVPRGGDRPAGDASAR